MLPRLLAVCLLLFSCSLADKEYYDEDTFAQLTEDLMKEIRKRISDSSSLEAESSTTTECEHDYGLSTTVDVIIKTRDSIAQGAEFILSPEVPTRSECVQQCCDEDNCNVAVFKDEGEEHSCYLFDCGRPGLCLFTNHTGFSVTHLPRKMTAKVQGLNHEEDLVKLADVSTTPTTTSTTTTTAKPTQPAEQPVPLFGKCNHDKDCAGSKTVCQVNYCVCQTNYHAQDGECRKDCSRFEYECANSGQPLTYPQCVALYDTCDGIEHCSDGSDERDCPAVGQEQPKSTVETEKDNSGEHKEGLDDNDSQYKKMKGGYDDNDSQFKHQDLGEKSKGSYDGDDDDSKYKHQDSEEKSKDKDKGGYDDNDSQYKHQNSEESKDGAAPTDKSTEKSGDDNDSAEKAAAHEQDGDTQPHVELLDGDSQAQLSKEEQEEFDEHAAVAQSNQGAVIALALGLSITALLLVFVGCRLRSVKRRLRRGRPLNSNEADYLVNGMYL